MIDIDYIDPVIAGLEDVFGKLLNCKVERTGLGSMDHNSTLHPVSGMIGFGGSRIGTIVLSMSETVAINAVSAFRAKDFSEMSEEVLASVGELTDNVCVGIIEKLPQFELLKSLPSVLRGDNIRIHFPIKSQPISIPFRCRWGNLTLQIGFVVPNDAQ